MIFKIGCSGFTLAVRVRVSAFQTPSVSVLSGVNFLSQEVRENRAFFVALPREFPLFVRATFTREFQIITELLHRM